MENPITVVGTAGNMTNYEKVSAWRRRTKAKAVALLGGKCVRCGYDKCLRALQFHHVNRATKDFAIYKALSSPRAWKNIEMELAKCVLLCANCHAEEEEAYDKARSTFTGFDCIIEPTCVCVKEDVPCDEGECGS